MTNTFDRFMTESQLAAIFGASDDHVAHSAALFGESRSPAAHSATAEDVQLADVRIGLRNGSVHTMADAVEQIYGECTGDLDQQVAYLLFRPEYNNDTRAEKELTDRLVGAIADTIGPRAVSAGVISAAQAVVRIESMRGKKSDADIGFALPQKYMAISPDWVIPVSQDDLAGCAVFPDGLAAWLNENAIHVSCFNPAVLGATEVNPLRHGDTVCVVYRDFGSYRGKATGEFPWGKDSEAYRERAIANITTALPVLVAKAADIVEGSHTQQVIRNMRHPSLVLA